MAGLKNLDSQWPALWVDTWGSGLGDLRSQCLYSVHWDWSGKSISETDLDFTFLVWLVSTKIIKNDLTLLILLPKTRRVITQNCCIFAVSDFVYQYQSRADEGMIWGVICLGHHLGQSYIRGTTCIPDAVFSFFKSGMHFKFESFPSCICFSPGVGLRSALGLLYTSPWVTFASASSIH